MANGLSSNNVLSVKQSSVILLIVACLRFMTGCAHSSNDIVPNRLTEAELHSETVRAFKTEERADIVILYEWSDRISLWIPPRSTVTEASEETMATAISSLTTKRELAVVTIGVVARYRLSDPQSLEDKVSAIENLLKAQGFKRVVFHLASAFGRPIYRE